MSFDLRYFHLFLDSLVVRISACHVEGPGSIPGRGGLFFLNRLLRKRGWKEIKKNLGS